MFHLRQSSLDTVHSRQKEEIGTPLMDDNVLNGSRTEDIATNSKKKTKESLSIELKQNTELAKDIRKKKRMNVSSVRQGTCVFHKAFGPGVVKEVGDGHILVDFDGSLKQFHFPGAFAEGFLQIV